MRDLSFGWPPFLSIGMCVAQIGPFQTDTWERLGFSGIGIFTTIYLWRHFSVKETQAQAARDKKEAEFRVAMIAQADEDKAERNRLLERLTFVNELQLADTKEFSRQLIQVQRDFLKANEDNQRSIKELLRKGHCPKINLPE